MMMYRQLLTANISKLGVSGLRKFSTFNQNCNGLIGSGTEIPASSYWQTVTANINKNLTTWDIN
ncbi:hypothetical protein FHX64_000082 [Microbacter margulisiae]|uniref:Uncharacterized protein n=1 Tax=Microbacter margulisiae TaxID=1350067 RepID=A0A7W5DNX9_9PORP|nr:hypothetical protein [Microbacter margulisiae]